MPDPLELAARLDALAADKIARLGWPDEQTLWREAASTIRALVEERPIPGTYGKGRIFDELAEISAARLRRAESAERALAETQLAYEGALGSIATMKRALAEARAALEAVGREAERIRDVRVNRTKVVGNIHLIVQSALSGVTPTPRIDLREPDAETTP
jgi:hypothetical protein